MEWSVPNLMLDSARRSTTPSRLRAAAVLSLAAHLVLVGFLWAEVASFRHRIFLAGGKGSAPLLASFARPQPTEAVVVERLSPTQVLIEPDHMHVDRRMFTPPPRIDAPRAEAKDAEAKDHDHDDHDHAHPHPHPHVHAPRVQEDAGTLTTPLAAAAPASVASAGAAAQATGNDETLPAPFDNPPPRYPAAAHQARLTGTTLLRVFINVDGRVERIEVVTSSGHAILDDAAADAVRKWRFTPGRRNGAAAPFALRLPIEFRL